MPIHINYAAEPCSESDPKGRIANPAFAAGEIKPKDQWRFTKRGFYQAERHMQFYMSNRGGDKPWEQKVAETYAWLSENIEGPWLFEDGWCNHGHSYDCSVHIERLDQRDKFAQTEHGKFFSRADEGKRILFPSLQAELTDIAVIKGIVKPYDSKESLYAWEVLHHGYTYSQESVDNVKKIYYDFQHEGVQKSFEENILSKGVFVKDDQGRYVCDENEYYKDSHYQVIYEWKKKNSGILMQSGGHGGDPDFFKYMFPYADIEEEFKENWGKYFMYDETRNLYFSNTYPPLPERELPADFIEYMHGRGPDPSLKLV